MIPPITFVMISVISEALTSLIIGCRISIPKLIRNTHNIVLENEPFLFCVIGNRKPKGMVMITFNMICLKKSPLSFETSINGTRFIGA